MEKEDFVFVKNVGNIQKNGNFPSWFMDWIEEEKIKNVDK